MKQLFIGQITVMIGAILVCLGLDIESLDSILGLLFVCLGISVINW